MESSSAVLFPRCALISHRRVAGEDEGKHSRQPELKETKINKLPKNYQNTPSMLNKAEDLIWNLWLFSRNDLFTFCGPNMVFGMFGALAGPLLLDNAELPLHVLARAPLVLLFNWSNLLILNVANQRLPESIEEDRFNKKFHRPLPSGRMTPLGARRLLLASLPVVLLVNYFLGHWVETLFLFVLDWMYNDLGGSDDDFIVRNLLIGLAFGLYNAGSLSTAGGPTSTINARGILWTTIISCALGTTVHIQDMKDQVGDRSRGRRTAPIVLGDGVARTTIAVPIAAWSLICPWFWDSSLAGYALTVPLGAYIIWRLYNDKSFQGDKLSWKLWTLWSAFLYLLPTVKQISS